MTRSALERKFDYYWEQLYPHIDLDAEVKLIPDRRFRFDYVHFPSLTAIEINGGLYIQGRHSRGKTMEADYEKTILAALQGYLVINLAGNQITPKYLAKIKLIFKVREKQLNIGFDHD